MVLAALADSVPEEVRELSAHATAVINVAADTHARIRLLRARIIASSTERAIWVVLTIRGGGSKVTWASCAPHRAFRPRAARFAQPRESFTVS